MTLDPRGKPRGRTIKGQDTCRVSDFLSWPIAEVAEGEIVTEKEEVSVIEEVAAADPKGETQVQEIQTPAIVPDSPAPVYIEVVSHRESTENESFPVVEKEIPKPETVSVPPVNVGANDYVCAFTVTLEREIKGKDLEATLAAILQIKNVAAINPVGADMQYFMAKGQARRELLFKIRDALKE
jgi:hypothetical protein